MHVHLQITDQTFRHHVGVTQVVTGIHPDSRYAFIHFTHQVQHYRRIATHAGGGDGLATQTQRPLHNLLRAGIAQGGVNTVKIHFHGGE